MLCCILLESPMKDVSVYLQSLKQKLPMFANFLVNLTHFSRLFSRFSWYYPGQKTSHPLWWTYFWNCLLKCQRHLRLTQQCVTILENTSIYCVWERLFTLTQFENCLSSKAISVKNCLLIKQQKDEWWFAS